MIWTGRSLGEWGLLGLLVALWGSAFAMITIVVETIPPVTAVSLRLALAFVALYAVMRYKGLSMPALKGERRAVLTAWAPLCGVAFFGNAFPFAAIMWGQKAVPSGAASILMAITPLVTLMLSHVFLKEERLTSSGVIGFLLGFLGVYVLLSPSNGNQGMGGASLLHGGAILAGALSYGISNVIARKTGATHPLSAATAMSLVAFFIITPVAFILESPWDIKPSLNSIIMLIGLGLFPTALANLIFFEATRRSGPPFVSLASYLLPLWAVLLGVIALKEAVTSNIIYALILILLGIGLSQFQIKLKKGSLE